MSWPMRLVTVLMLLATTTVSCKRQDPGKPESEVLAKNDETTSEALETNKPAPKSNTGDLPSELTALLDSSCKESLKSGRPVLLEFGADWCKDCRELHGMRAQPPLAQELAQWNVVDVDITDPEKYEDLTKAFRVGAIARWVVLRPTDCSTSVVDWPRGPARVVEPKTGRDANALQLVAWLRKARS